MNTLARHSSTTALLLVVLIFGIAAFVAAAGRTPDPTVAPTPALSSFIMVIATRQIEPRQQIVIERVIQVVVTATPQLAEPQAVYQEMAPSATPYTADPQMSYTEADSTVQIDVPTDAPRLCDGFGDFRDYDAMYASSPACHP